MFITMKAKIVLILTLLALNTFALAENGCPNGESPIGPRSDANPLGCIIDHDLNRQQAQPEQPQAPRGRWETRWGAIATDAVAGTLAGVVNFSSKQSAQKAAFTQCKANGGENCLVRIAFYNQCAVIASGDTFHTSQSAGTVKIASDIALQECAYKTNNCKIYYSDCSPPVWISY
jgi:hypothetical protein